MFEESYLRQVIILLKYPCDSIISIQFYSNSPDIGFHEFIHALIHHFIKYVM